MNERVGLHTPVDVLTPILSPIRTAWKNFTLDLDLHQRQAEADHDAREEQKFREKMMELTRPRI